MNNLELRLKQTARDIWDAVPYQQFIIEAVTQVSCKGYSPTDSEEKLKSFMTEVRAYGKTTTAAPRDLAAQLFNIEHDRITTARTDSPLAKALVAKFKENTPSKK